MLLRYTSGCKTPHRLAKHGQHLGDFWQGDTPSLYARRRPTCTLCALICSFTGDICRAAMFRTAGTGHQGILDLKTLNQTS